MNSFTEMKNYTVALLISLRLLTQYGEKACLQIENIGIHGKMLSIIGDLHSNTNGHVTVRGVKQGDPPSQFFLNVYMNLLKRHTMEKYAFTINSIKIQCLFGQMILY